MPPTLSWSDLPGRRVGVWGLGVEGEANLRSLPRCAASSRCWSTTRRRPTPAAAVLATGDGGLDALAGCDVVVKTPGHQPLRAGGRRAGGRRASRSSAGSACGSRTPTVARVACITGTKGKSTTTAIAGHLLRAARATAAWSAATSACRRSTRTVDQDVDYWVVEVSSYQATDLPVTPPVVRGHLAAPGPPALARRRSGGLLPRQALAVHAARRRPHGRQRRQRAAPRAPPPARPAGALGARDRRPGRALAAAAGPARRPQPAQRADRPRRPARTSASPARTTRRPSSAPPRGTPSGEPAPGRRRGVRGDVRRRQPVDQRAADARRGRGVPRPPGRPDRRRPGPRHRLPPRSARGCGRGRRRCWSSRCRTTARASAR